jgi:hypothetical protein
MQIDAPRLGETVVEMPMNRHAECQGGIGLHARSSIRMSSVLEGFSLTTTSFTEEGLLPEMVNKRIIARDD